MHAFDRNEKTHWFNEKGSSSLKTPELFSENQRRMKDV